MQDLRSMNSVQVEEMRMTNSAFPLQARRTFGTC